MALIASPAWAAPADNTWTQLTSLPEKLDAPVLAIAVSPSNPLQVLLGTGSGSVYRSGDAGVTWTLTGHAMGRGVVSLAFSPFKAGLVFAGTRGQGIWRSTDSGATWARQQPSGPMTIRSFAFAKSQSLAGGDSGLFTSRDGIAWAPIPALKDLSLVALAAPAVNDPARFLAGGDASRGVEALPLYQSQDGGSTWTLLKAGLGSSSMVAAAAAGPLPAKGDVRPLVVGTNVGAYLSVDNGATWTQAAGLPAVDYNAVGFVSNHPERFYLASDGGGSVSGGLWSTADAGQTFRTLQPPVPSVTALALSAEDTPTLYVATFRPIDHAVHLWTYRDAGGTPAVSAALPAPARSVAPKAVRVTGSGWLSDPAVPYVALSVLALAVLFLAVVFYLRSGKER